MQRGHFLASLLQEWVFLLEHTIWFRKFMVTRYAFGALPNSLVIIVSTANFLTKNFGFPLYSNDIAITLIEWIGQLWDSLEVIETIAAYTFNTHIGCLEHTLNSHDFVLIGDWFCRYFCKLNLLLCTRKLQVRCRCFFLFLSILYLEFIQFVLLYLILKNLLCVYVS